MVDGEKEGGGGEGRCAVRPECRCGRTPGGRDTGKEEAENSQELKSPELKFKSKARKRNWEPPSEFGGNWAQRARLVSSPYTKTGEPGRPESL
ncbi:hypothetical protein N7468_000608 [Penicillium chermesinum]|uniref:Uncharacterized protein n=1 Tax=Penicillium chermesinum TaxID=63820 RepID=A0A9W9TYJ9_9EURO|nr:uncharacterized protein N7468_000608 [Penicillium chermesinum]KAJ5249157.1 hypothetical protein N7468_000608 [Penicillium chermesinum]